MKKKKKAALLVSLILFVISVCVLGFNWVFFEYFINRDGELE